MKTAKEKAHDLIVEFWYLVPEYGTFNENNRKPFDLCKECASTLVDHMIKEWSNEEGRIAKQAYWREVKEEINKL